MAKRTFVVGQQVEVRFGERWLAGEVTGTDHWSVTVYVGTQRVSIHESVYRRDLRLARSSRSFSAQLAQAVR